MKVLSESVFVIYSFDCVFKNEISWKGKKRSTFVRKERTRVFVLVVIYRIDHKSGGHRVVFCHRAKLLASFLGKLRMMMGQVGGKTKSRVG